MAVFRVERNKGYTVMSNHHLRNKELSLKAKGLLSQMLSLPEDWDYTLAGLSFINREKIDAIREAVKELERAGYIVRSRERDEKGRLRGADYVIFEQPQTPPVSDLPTLENPTLDNPTLEKPTQEKPTLENPTQLNKDIQKTNLPKKEKSNIDLSSTDSIPIHSLNPLPYDGEAAEPPERKRKEATDAYSVYEEIIKDNIEYDHFVRYGQVDKDRLDEIVSIILETVCSKRKTIRIAGDDYPAELVKAKFMKLNSSHIEFVFDCMKENTTKIDYQIPAEALTDSEFAAIYKEAQKYVGTPYVWGGSTPETGFDCSGYVCWVYNQNGYDVGRTTANGLWQKSQHISEAEAKPGDLVFFKGTYDTPGMSHTGIYLGNGMMVSAGDPIKYANIHSSYWEKHLAGFGRLSK